MTEEKKIVTLSWFRSSDPKYVVNQNVYTSNVFNLGFYIANHVGLD